MNVKTILLTSLSALATTLSYGREEDKDAADAALEKKADGAAVGSAPAGEHDPSDLAKQSQNPIANLISLPFQNNFNFGSAEGGDLQWTLNVQPVIPVELNDDWLLINRAIIPITQNPTSLGGEGGLGDIQYQGFLSPQTGSDFTWGIGPVLGFPAATDSTLGARRWTAGPAFVGLLTKGPWVVGATVNHQWDWGGSGDSDVNLTFIQPFVNDNMANGWYLTSDPAMSINWEADTGDKWTVPLGAGIGKVGKIGKQHVNVKALAFYNVAKPDLGPDWSARLQITLLFPK